MATNKKTFTVTFSHFSDHKKVKRFNATDEEAPVKSIYVDNATLKAAGEPKEIEGVFTAK